MRGLIHTSQFKRDYKKRSHDKQFDVLLERVLEGLIQGKKLDPKLKDHPLKGGYVGCRECHLKPDLLLIYVQNRTEIHLIRLGSHSELFD